MCKPLLACRLRLEARQHEAESAAAAVTELTQEERKLEAEVEEAGKAVRARKDEADALKDTENADAQHVQVCQGHLKGMPGRINHASAMLYQHCSGLSWMQRMLMQSMFRFLFGVTVLASHPSSSSLHMSIPCLSTKDLGLV